MFKVQRKSDSGGILTRDLRNRNPTLYTAKLRSHLRLQSYIFFPEQKNFLIKNSTFTSFERVLKV